MDSHKVREILKKEIDEIKGLAHDVGDGFDKEAIHDFRVAVKTLRSFLRILNMQKNNPKIKLTKKFKRLYRISGVIRDTQLETKSLEEKALMLPVYLDSLNKKIERKKMEWQKHYSKKVMRKLEHRLTNKAVTLADVSLAAFVATKISLIHQLCDQPLLTNDQVHTIRKQVKDIVYSVKTAKKSWRAGYDAVKGVHLKNFQLVADAIGKFNDDRIILDHLRSFHSRLMADEEQHTLTAYCKEENVRLRKMKKKALTVVAKHI